MEVKTIFGRKFLVTKNQMIAINAIGHIYFGSGHTMIHMVGGRKLPDLGKEEHEALKALIDAEGNGE